MLGHTHALFGLTTLAVAQATCPFIQPHPVGDLPTGPILCVGAAIFGALLPDIDGQDSTIGRELGLLGKITTGTFQFLGIKHRGLTHFGLTAILLAILEAVLGYAFGYLDVGLAFGLGYLSHVALADALTIRGVPLLWPLPRKFHLLPKPLRVRTGGPVESLIFVGLLLVCLALLRVLIPPELLEYLQ